MGQNEATNVTRSLGSEPDSSVEKYSVGGLVNKWINPEDAWKLALVQRRVVWDDIRMKRLLDSLLAGYPIGTLLVCRVRQPSKVLLSQDGTRKAVELPPGAWQLLDGQQRINALGCIFTDKGRFGRFLVDMFARRYPEEIATRQRARGEATRYMEKLEADREGFQDTRKIRERYLDLSRWHRWSQGLGESRIWELLKDLQQNPGDRKLCFKILNDIDPAFADEPDDEPYPIIAGRMRRLLEIWTQPFIPVQKITLDSPQDVLQVFVRANLEGVRLDGEDVFFAAVKTIWNDAEENLDRVAATTPLLNRMTALRLLARLASRAIGPDDLLPLRVERLNPPKGQQIIDVMCHLANDEMGFLAKTKMLGDMLTSKSRLGHGLFNVNPILFDHVFAWAAVNTAATDSAFLSSQLPNIDAYLLGSTSFQYPTVFLDAFARLGFEEALAAGRQNGPFPLQRIVIACKETWHGLKRGMRSVPADKSEEGHLEIADSNATLFLSIVQNLPYTLPLRYGGDDERSRREVEWDHIYAQALARKMRVPHEKTGRLVYHPYREFVWSAGNLWALDRPLNTCAQDRPPSEKFALLELVKDKGHPSRWPSFENAFLTKEEELLLGETEDLLKEANINIAMEKFREFARGRALRLYGEIRRLFPDLGLFAAAEEDLQVEYEPPSKAALRHELGLEDVEMEPVQKETPLPMDKVLESIFALAGQRGSENELRKIVDAAREMGLYARPYRWCVMITPPNMRTRMLFTLWPKREEERFFIIERSSQSVAECFPLIGRERARALGKDGTAILKLDEVPAFIASLREVFSGKVSA
jgi:hypothetical protein